LPVKANGLVRLRSPGSFGSVGQRVDADDEHALLLRLLGGAALAIWSNTSVELLAEEDRDDRRRRLVGTQRWSLPADATTARSSPE
jgi:hypothetical protein